MRVIAVVLGALLALTSVSVREGALGQVTTAPSYPTPKEGDWIAKDFRFHTGAIMPELRVHYTTVGEPSGEPVVVLHGPTGSGTGMLSRHCGRLVGLASHSMRAKYYIILPDAIGHGKSAKPSDGLRAKFPQYDYDDMVVAQYRLVTEGLGVRHARMVIGLSMGGMQIWMWGETYPDFMDTFVPMASQPSAMSSRNWMMRRLITEGSRNDPDWKTVTTPASLGRPGLPACSTALRRRAGRWRVRSWHRPGKRPTSCSMSVSLPPSQPTRTTRCINGSLQATTILRRDWSAFRQPCSRSIRRMTNAIHPKPASWSVNSSA